MSAHETPSATLEPLTSEDREILRLESETVAGHTLKVAILDPPGGQGRPDAEALRVRISDRIERAPALGRKLQMRPRQRPAWVHDPAFDVREHVRAVSVTAPVSHDDLGASARA